MQGIQSANLPLTPFGGRGWRRRRRGSTRGWVASHGHSGAEICSVAGPAKESKSFCTPAVPGTTEGLHYAVRAVLSGAYAVRAVTPPRCAQCSVTPGEPGCQAMAAYNRSL